MRNLKRALSLAMASVMLLGMMVVGTSAVSYADVDVNDHVEAIEVLQKVGVMTGDEKGNFNPDKAVTRAEMAVVMANLLDLKVENYYGASPFKDVPQWASPYVAACYANGITAGTSATTYNPNGNVKAVEAALMLMKALGYFQYQSDFGESWTVSVIRQASKIDLWGDLNVSVDTQLTRDQVAALALNALEATMVEANKEGQDITIGDISISGNVTYDNVTNTNSKYAAINDDKDDGKYTVELGEQLYSGDLKKVEDTPDDFGRPSAKWSYKNSEIGKYAQEADATYTAEVKSKDMYSDLDLSKTTTVDVIEDGKVNGTFTIQKSNSTAKIGGNGILVEAYKDDDDNVTLVKINTYVGEITKVTAAKDGDERTVTVKGESAYETEGFEKEDIVLYTKADGEIQTMALAEKVEGVEVSTVSGTSSFVADGTTYKFNATSENKTAAVKDVKVDSVLDLYLDSYGYVVKVDVSKASSDYAYVIKTGADEGRYDDDANYYAKLLMADGTTVEAEIDEDSLTGSKFSDKKAALEKMAETIVEYTKNSKDVYKLEKLDDTTGLKSGKNIEINKGESGMKLGDTDNNYYANSKTIFLVQSGEGNKATYTVYTGYANVPDLKDSSGNYAVYCKNGTVATMVFISDVAASSDDIVFVLGSKAGTKIVDSDDTYYEYKAVVNGEITTVYMDEKVANDGKSDGDVLFGNIAYADAEKEILDTSACDKYNTKAQDKDNYQMTAKVTAEEDDDIIGLDSKNYAVSSDVEVYGVTSADKIESASLADVEKGMTVTAIVKNGEIVTIFYGVTKSSGGSNDDAEIAGDVTTTKVVNASDLSSKANGAYVLTQMPEDKKDDIGGEITDNMFFTFRTADADQNVSLTITNSRGEDMYVESDDFASKGFHYFYVQVIGDGINNAAKGYPMSSKALASGSYDWQIVNTGTGEVLVDGSFTIR